MSWKEEFYMAFSFSKPIENVHKDTKDINLFIFFPNREPFVLLFHIVRQVNTLLLFPIVPQFRVFIEYTVCLLLDFDILIIGSIWSHIILIMFSRTTQFTFVEGADRMTGRGSQYCVLHGWLVNGKEGCSHAGADLMWYLLVTVWFQIIDIYCFTQTLLVAKNSSPLS